MHANLWPLSLLIPSLLHEGDITITIYIEKDHGSSERLRNPDPGMKRKRRDPHQSDSKAHTLSTLPCCPQHYGGDFLASLFPRTLEFGNRVTSQRNGLGGQIAAGSE